MSLGQGLRALVLTGRRRLSSVVGALRRARTSSAVRPSGSHTSSRPRRGPRPRSARPCGPVGLACSGSGCDPLPPFRPRRCPRRPRRPRPGAACVGLVARGTLVDGVGVDDEAAPVAVLARLGEGLDEARTRPACASSGRGRARSPRRPGAWCGRGRGTRAGGAATRSRLLSSTMSMKSMTMMPPMSRSRSWRTISSAASRLFFVTVSSRLPPEPMNLPVLTSTTVIASVRSMTSEPPRRQPDLAVHGLGELLVDAVVRRRGPPRTSTS